MAMQGLSRNQPPVYIERLEAARQRATHGQSSRPPWRRPWVRPFIAFASRASMLLRCDGVSRDYHRQDVLAERLAATVTQSRTKIEKTVGMMKA